MDVRQRLELLLEGDAGLKDLNTNLNKAQAVQPARVSDGADLVAEPEKAKQGVSGYAFPVDFDPEKGMKYPKSGQFPLSYIRTHVVGELAESEDNLTDIDQDDRAPSRTPIDHDSSDELKDEHGSVSDEEPVTAIQFASSFTPAVTMARFPFKYLHGENFKKVNDRFYAGDKFWNRTWDLYYLSVPKAISPASFLLIPTFQAQALISEINSALNIKLTLVGTGKEGLVMEFNNEKLVRPLFLGRSSTPGQKAKLYGRIPPGLENWGPWTKLVEPHVFEEFEKKIKQSIATIKNKHHGKQASRDAQMKKWQECLCRAQAYFGLRPAFQPNVPQPSFTNGQVDAIDVLKPVKWTFQDAPIFICIDLEWMDRYGWLTEVGISTLDMMDLQGVVPGDYGHMWMKQVRSRHLRVAEYRNWVNSTYSTGCPGSFRFGKSEMIASAEVGKVVDAAFHPPYMVPLKDEMVPSYKNQKRTVILVGLDLHGDIMHLQKAGSKVFINKDGPSSVIRETFDVAELYRVEAGESQKRGLRALLGILNILSPDLHNAGNDAHYTLHALVRMMLRVAGEKPWGYESAEVSDAELKPEPSNTPKVTINPKDMPKFESMVPTCEEAVDTDDAAVWSH
ncbi:hypothetical protein N7491_005019 [Penicillium cf. griseofulvum]|uniref:Gfd2/YDR514C-like C-terminal domain-containing protein n=1 Tax=Penicillium cf. griseofulvum TaxID=2972120 RepID=A0A9W9J138_9EURO|nr:hypothetical protein N7472_007712 [Penicillium cf. griseofulvum]KAJ5434424.1 hypothetical protein N7491_005019 [Penicillium cf. griseofulvum]